MSSLDFSRLQRTSVADSSLEPRQIFSALTKASGLGYPRDVQTEVWDAWHERRTESDLVIKMNTGAGKTVVGLVLLKACLNEGVGPAVYVTPDRYLAGQVLDEAERVGIRTSENLEDPAVLSGQAVLIVNVFKLFNGQSVFGVRDSKPARHQIGTFLVDDAHACLTTVDQQFSLRIASDHSAYLKLTDLFTAELKQQSPSRLADIGSGDFSAVMEVPYWAWQDKREEVLNVLHQYREEQDFVFRWPLIAEDLRLCRVALSAKAIEIAPLCVPIERVPVFRNAQRRMYLTATLANDSVLVTHFGAAAETIARPITPRTADDIGDRLIIAPQELFPELVEADLRKFFADQAQDCNVVVIVPSHDRAKVWAPIAAAILDSASIDSGLHRLRSGQHVGLVVLVNRYDGIDLPGDACRILVLDGLPEAQGELERLDAAQLEPGEESLSRQIQRIEQGMGRGVRSTDDYCAVVLLGARLASRLHQPGARQTLSPATEAQLNFADQVAELVSAQGATALGEAVDRFLSRDPDLVTASRGAVANLTYPENSFVSPISVAERRAFIAAQAGDFNGAAEILKNAPDAVTDQQLQGVLLQRAAAYKHGADKAGAQKLQAAARKKNMSVLKPRAGASYERLTNTQIQATAASEYLSAKYDDGLAVKLGFAELCELLRPSEDPTKVRSFESALAELGRHLGLTAQEPEQEQGEGPDVLWSLGSLSFVVIECKSGATSTTISKSDLAQLSTAADWFNDKYDLTCNVVPVIIHPSRTAGAGATAPENAQVITFEKLDGLLAGVDEFASSVSQNALYRNAKAVGERLVTARLNSAQFVEHWGQDVRRRSRSR